MIPRQERFFDDFQALAEQIQAGARLLEEMLAPDPPLWDKADEIKEVEHAEFMKVISPWEREHLLLHV